jgi:hypothetical protein
MLGMRHNIYASYESRRRVQFFFSLGRHQNHYLYLFFMISSHLLFFVSSDIASSSEKKIELHFAKKREFSFPFVAEFFLSLQ